MKVGYIRVSTVEQNEGRQVKDLQATAGVEKVFMDKLSGKDTNRPQFNAMLEFVREGDTVVVSSYDRLARSTADLLATIETLKAKGVNVISMKEQLDTSTPQGKLMLTFFAGIATSLCPVAGITFCATVIVPQAVHFLPSDIPAAVHVVALPATVASL